MPTESLCGECGAEIPTGSPDGFCTRCLIGAVLDPDPGGVVPGEIAPPEAETEPGTTAAPRKMGDYLLLEEIARGGMGVVWRARQASLNRIVAVKLIVSGHFASREQSLRFRAEAEVAARLRHPNIVAIHETGDEGGMPFFSMEYAEGGDLVRWVRERSPSARASAGLLRTVAEAIHYAHAHGVLHRDLKPSNILLDASGRPLVTDFGLARCLERGSSLTLTGQVLGSPDFLPPEQAGARGLGVGPTSDVYSLGAVLFYLLTGRPPFIAGTIAEKLRAVLEAEPVSPRLLNAGVPEDLATICLKCLHKDPARRYAAAQDLAEDLGRFLRHEPIHARQAGRAERMARWARREPALAASLAALLTVIGAGFLGVLWNWRRAESARVESERKQYGDAIQLATRSIEAGDLPTARDYLDRIARSADQRPLQGWEYRHLLARSEGDALAVLGRMDSWVSAVAASPNGRWIAAVAENGDLAVWDSDTRRLVRSWSAHPTAMPSVPVFRLHAVRFTTDGGTLVTAGADGAIRFWKTAGWEPARAPIRTMSTPAARIAVSRDGVRLAACTLAGVLSIWDLTTEPANPIGGRTTGIALAAGLEFSADGTSLFVGGAEQPLQRFELAPDGSLSSPVVLTGTSPPLSLSADGRWLASAGTDGNRIEIVSLESGQRRAPILTRGGGVRSLAFEQGGSRLAAGLLDGQIAVVDPGNGLELVTLAGHEEMVCGLAFVGASSTFVSASYDRSLRLWEASASRGGHRTLRHGERVLAVAFAPDSQSLATVASEPVEPGRGGRRADFSLRLWNVATLAPRGAVTNTPQGLRPSVAFAAHGAELAVDDYGTVTFHALPGMAQLGRIPGRTARQGTLAAGAWHVLSEHGVMQSANGTGPFRLLPHPVRNPTTLAVSPDGKVIAIGNQQGSIRLLDARGGRDAGVLSGLTEWIREMAFSPDGRCLAAASWDSTFGLWDVRRGELLGRLRAHAGGVDGIAFSPDGRTLATCGADSSVRLWSVERHEPLAVLHGHGAAVNAVAFSPDGIWLASASDDGTVRLWSAAAGGIPHEDGP